MVSFTFSQTRPESCLPRLLLHFGLTFYNIQQHNKQTTHTYKMNNFALAQMMNYMFQHAYKPISLVPSAIKKTVSFKFPLPLPTPKKDKLEDTIVEEEYEEIFFYDAVQEEEVPVESPVIGREYLFKLAIYCFAYLVVIACILNLGIVGIEHTHGAGVYRAGGVQVQ